MTKPFQYEEVIARVESQLALRRARRELTQRYAELQQLERQRDNLVHMVVHDLRSPLAVLRANGVMLKDALAGHVDDDNLSMLDELLLATDRLADMTDNLLDLSRLEAGVMPLQRADTDLAELMQRVAAQ